MVLPENIVDAAYSGDVITVRAWLDEDAAHDVNDVDDSGVGLLNCAGASLEIEDPALIALLLARGVDVNQRRYWTTLQLACAWRSVGAVELLLSHGADADLVTLEHNHPPLMMVLGSFESFAGIGDLARYRDRAARTNRTLLTYCRDIYACIVLLLRAGASPDGRTNIHPETLLTLQIGDIPAPTHPDFLPKMELRLALDRLKAVRAAGGWRKWTLVPPKKLLRLRSLHARGRARLRVSARAARANAKMRPIVWLMSPNVPNEIAWRVLEFWNPRSDGTKYHREY